jgi:hypothetical protein
MNCGNDTMQLSRDSSDGIYSQCSRCGKVIIEDNFNIEGTKESKDDKNIIDLPV